MNSLALLPNNVIAVYIFLFGLCIGSFLNVAVLRGLSGEDMVFARSKCPKCNNQLKWYMNIPLLSYIFLLGKCAFCKCKISPQYPLVEFICATLFTCAFFAFGLSLNFVFICIFLAIFITMSATDFKETVIIDYHAYLLLAFGLLYSFLNLGNVTIFPAICAAAFGFLFFEIVSRAGALLIGQRIFGEGDSLIALGLGAIFGYKNLIIIIVLSILLQSFIAVPILAKNAYKEGNKKLSLTYISTFIAIILAVAINSYSLINFPIIYYPLLIGTVLISIWSLKNILEEIKRKKEIFQDNENQKTIDEKAENTFHLMPFGPALLTSATICIFHLSTIKDFIKSFFE